MSEPLRNENRAIAHYIAQDANGRHWHSAAPFSEHFLAGLIDGGAVAPIDVYELECATIDHAHHSRYID